MTAEPGVVPGIFVGNAWRPAHGRGRHIVIGAATEEPLGEVPLGDAADVDAAVRSARAAFDDPTGWAWWPAEQRAESMQALAASLAARRSRIAEQVSRQNGMPLSLSGGVEAATPPALLKYYARLVRTYEFEESRRGPGGSSTVVRKEPVGVVGAIVPWNYPQSLAAFKYAPALAAGCTIVLKPSPETTLDLLAFAEAVQEAGLPPGVISIVPGGRGTGAALVDHPDLDKVAFTGSTATGRLIAQACARRLRPVTLELGGKSAAIVLDDADLARDLDALFSATLLNNGQTCYLNTRILVPRSRYDEIVGLVAEMASGLVVGDPLERSTQIGPVASAAQRDRVEKAIASGRADGFRLVTGGGRPKGFERGYFVEPTVFADVDNRSFLAREEVFGPVLAVTGYDGDDEAVSLANDSDYGLGGSVWSTDPERAMSVARRVRTGSIGVNGYRLDIGAPFGGIKASGLGRELGPEGLTACLQVKSIYRL